MKRLAGVILALGAVFGMNGSVHAATVQNLVAGRATLSDGSRITVSATRANDRATGSITVMEGSSGASVTGKAVCQGDYGLGEAVVAQVTRSTDEMIPVGSYFAAVFGSASFHRASEVLGGPLNRFSVNPDGTCGILDGYPTFSGYVTSGAILVY